MLVLLVLLVAMQRGAAAPLSAPVQSYSVTEGLPNRWAQALWAAPSGALWVGTPLGVVRFDGTSFYAPPALAGVDARALAGAGERWLWIVGPAGVRRLDLRSGAVRAWARPDADAPVGAYQQVQAVLVSRAGLVYIGTQGGWLLRYDPARDRFRRLARAVGVVPTYPAWLNGLAEDSAGNVWCSTNHARGVYRYDPRRATLHLYPDRAVALGKPAFLFLPALVGVGARGGVAANFPGLGIARYQPATDSFQPLDLPPDHLRADLYQPALHLDTQGRYWFARRWGTLRAFDPATGDTLDLSPPLRAVTAIATCLQPDGAGGLWVGTTNGLLHLAPRAAPFTTALVAPAGSPADRRVSLRGIAEVADGRLLIASYQGLFSYDLRTAAAARPVAVATNSRSPLLAYTIVPDSAGRGAWLATEGRGLTWLNLRTNTAHVSEYQTDDRRRPVSPFGRVLLREADGSIWLGTYVGLFRVTNPGTAAARYHRVTARQWPEVASLDCFALIRRGGEIWIGARQGLYMVNARTGTVRRLRPGQVSAPVRALWVEPGAAAVVWLGTAGGLVRFAPTGPPAGQLRIFDQRAGLSHDVVAALLPDSTGGLWVSTDNGLTRFDLQTSTCQRFLPADGLSAAEFNHGSALRTRAGQLVFGSVNGLTSLAPRQLSVAPPARVLLTRLAWFDGATRREQVRHLGLTPGTALTLDPNDEGFTLHYALTDFADPARHRFRYRLRGLEAGWTAAGAAHALHYSRLPAGRYVLELRAAGADGRWLPTLTLLHVRVVAPFYARWWFVLLLGLAAAGLVTAAWRYRLRRLRELAAVRVQLAADLHDEVGAWLTRVSLHAELARVGSPTPAHQHQQLEKLTAASRQAIATMSDVVWAVDARNDTLGDLIDRLREQANQLLEPHGIAFDFRADGLDRARSLPPDLRQHLFLIGKEAIHNIVRHSATTHARVWLGNRAGAFELEVADDGPPREPRAAGSRQGLRNMQLRASRLPGATLTVTKEGGYVVRLRLAHSL